jgi:predicted dehydrogenase
VAIDHRPLTIATTPFPHLRLNSGSFMEERMATLKVGIAGGGWPGLRHAEGYLKAGGCKIIAVADLIPERRAKLRAIAGTTAREYADAQQLIDDKEIDAISICLPTDQHAPFALAAMKAGKHVIIESPPTPTLKAARQLASAAGKRGRVLMYAMQRRFGAAEQATKQAIEKGYAGAIYHIRASWTRTRGVPVGTGWYTEADRSGGGAMIDLGLPLIDLAWSLLGHRAPVNVYCITHKRLGEATPTVEDAAVALVRFEGGACLELTTSWALNQPPAQKGMVCRLSGEAGAIDVYTSRGPMLYRGFDAGAPKEAVLKLPKTSGHAALLRHFRDCILNGTAPVTGPATGVVLMSIIEAMYKSALTGKSVDLADKLSLSIPKTGRVPENAG